MATSSETPAPVLEDGPALESPAEPIQEQNNSQLFHNENGSISMFIDPAHGNPASKHRQVLLAIKNHGGTIVLTAVQANVVLINPDTYTGRQFIRTALENTLVLDYRWTAACIDAGRVLLSDDNWGGFRPVDDGLPIVAPQPDDESDQPVASSSKAEITPLPTPRQTPPSAPPTLTMRGGARRSPSASGRQTGIPSRGRAVSSGVSRASLQRSSLDREVTPHSASAAHTRFPSLNPSDALAQPQSSLPASSSTPQPNNSTPDPTNAMNFDPSQMMPQMQQMFTQMQHMQQMMMSNPAMMQMFMMNMGMGGSFNGIPGPAGAAGQQLPMNNFANPMLGGGMPGPYGMQNMNGMNMMPNGMNAPPGGMNMAQNGMNGGMYGGMGMSDMAGAQFHGGQQLTNSGMHPPHTAGTPDLELIETPESISQSSRSSTLSKPTSTLSKPSSSYPSDTQTFKRKIKKVERSISVSTSSSRASSPAPRKSTGPIFANKKFFVEIGLNKRSDITKMIKSPTTGGGTIVTSPEEADYAVVCVPSGKDTANHVSRAILNNVPALSAQFIRACVHEGLLVSPEDYEVEGPPSSKRGKEKKKEPIRIQLKKTEVEKAKAKAAKVRAESVKVKSKVNASASSSSASTSKAFKEKMDEVSPKVKSLKRSAPAPAPTTWPRELRSPSPVPFGHQTPDAGGRYAYTNEEREYGRKYVQILFKRKPNWTNFEMSAALHSKMPIHTAGSWANFVSNESKKGDFDKWRKAAGIAFRKKEAQAAATWEEPPPAKKQKVSKEDFVAMDTEVCAEFFVNGGDSMDGDESSIWDVLTEKSPCKSEESWAKFYEAHHTTVMARYHVLKAEESD